MYIAPRLLTTIYTIDVGDKISGQSIVDEPSALCAQNKVIY